MAARHISHQRQLVFHPRTCGDFIEGDAGARLANPAAHHMAAMHLPRYRRQAVFHTRAQPAYFTWRHAIFHTSASWYFIPALRGFH
jgi:hypothetical protein